MPSPLARLIDSANPMQGRLHGSPLTLRSFRLSCLLAAVLLPLFGALYHATGRTVVDPWTLRWAGSALALAALAATYVSETARRFTCPLHQTGVYATTAYFGWLAYANGLSADYAVGYLFVFGALSLAHSLAYTHQRPFAQYLVVSTAVALAVTGLSTQAEVSQPLFAMSVVAFAALLYVAVGARMATFRALEFSQAQHTEAEALAGAGSWELSLPDDRRSWSEGTYRLLGLSPDGEAGRILDYVHPDDRPETAAIFGRTAHLGGTAEHTFRVVAADGTTRTLRSISRAVAGRDGTVVHGYGALLDVTGQVAREEALRDARDQAEEAVRAKSAFLANMSHEIRTPLTAIIGYAQLLAEEAGPGQRDLVDPIVSGGGRLLDTLNSVLDLARMEAGHTDLAVSAVDAAAEARAALQLFGSQAAARGLALRDETPDTPVWVSADHAALGRVLANLVSNAVKFTSEGHVSVAVAAASGGSVHVTVEDTGRGMSPEFLDRLYEPFQQASTGWARSHEGTGLGLTIVRRLAEGMGGQIAAESRVGRGTRFTLSLRAAPGPDGAQQADEAVSERARAAA